MRALLLLPMLALAACDSEPEFDERYDKAAKEIEARAKAMDANVAEADAAAKAAGEVASPETRPIEPGGKIPRSYPEPLPDTVDPTKPPASSGE